MKPTSRSSSPFDRDDSSTISHERVDVRAGDDVVAADGRLGRVECVLRAESAAPTYLVVAVGTRLRRRYPVVPWGLVAGVDGTRRRVHVRSERKALERLPETLPLVV